MMVQMPVVFGFGVVVTITETMITVAGLTAVAMEAAATRPLSFHTRNNDTFP